MSENRGIFYTFRNFENFDELFGAVSKFVGLIALGGIALSFVIIVFVLN